MRAAPRSKTSSDDGGPTYSPGALSDFARSGIRPTLAAALGIAELSAAEAKALGHDARRALLFPYFDPFANRFTELKTFHRVRYLDPPAGFAGLVRNPQRYSQPHGTLNQVYVPRRVAGVDYAWPAFLRNVDEPLFVTEGEKKAICACEHGLPCVGLGGVDVFAARGRGAHALPFFDHDGVDLRRRRVYVVFDSDSDAGLKDTVLEAAKRLLLMLLERGALPHLVALPSDGPKVGFDDYLVAHGLDRFLSDVLPVSGLDYSDARGLLELIARYGYVRDVDRFVDLAPEQPPALFTARHLDAVVGRKQFAMRRPERVRVQGGGFEIRYLPRVTDASDALLLWPATDRFSKLAYRPGLPRVLDDGALNLWTGWRCEYGASPPSARARDQALGEWRWAVDNLFGDDPVAREFVEHWIFYPLRFPGAKLATFALVCSPDQGIGKSFVGHMLAKHVYGLLRPGPCHAWQITEGDLHGQFNPYLQATSFVEGDDVAAHDRKSVYERVKSFVTSDTVQINLKNTPQFMLENRANFWLTSNDHAPFYLDSRDRRAFAHSPRKARKDPARYRALQEMFDAGVAGQALLWYARERYDPRAFNETTEAPMTDSKRLVVSAARSAPRDWIADLVAEPDSMTRPFATPRELHALLSAELPGGDRCSVDALGHALRDAGAQRWAHGGLTPTRGGARERVWVLGDFARVLRLSRDALAREISAIPFGRAGTKEKF